MEQQHTNVLIVDDSPTMRRMVAASLREIESLSFDEAGSGLDAIERLALEPANLIVLDLNMPDMHGLELLAFLRKHQNFRSTPVIVLTTRDDDASRSAALAAGATVYLTKPFAPHELAEQARKLLAPVEPEK